MEERRRKCVSRWLRSEPNKTLLKPVYEPRPVFDDGPVVSSTGEDDDNDVFITPVPRQSGTNARKKFKVAASPSFQRRENNTILNYVYFG